MKRFTLLLLALILAACSSAPETAPEELPTILPVATLTPSPAPSAPQEALPTPELPPPPAVSRVFIVTFDGLRPEAIELAKMTNVQALMESGAYTLRAQTVKPSSTLPAHAAMVTGTCPAKNGVRWNEYVPRNGYAVGTDIFDLARAVGLRTVVVAGKEKLRQLSNGVDYFGWVDNSDDIEDEISLDNMALDQIKKGFGVMLVHFLDGDTAGHKNGWLSKQQLSAYKRNDQTLGRFISAMKKSGYYDGTLFIITADHGGNTSNPKHGNVTPEAMTIPWVVSGPGVAPGELQTQVYIMDTAATAAFAMGLPLQPEWDGIPVYEAFGMPFDPLRQGGCPNVTP
ncbi:MAG: alkaline phosphatase family protein [Anaerolineales bacterium]|nr:alkaline phosphatase family protein [Anaerolineales bacterium]